MNHQQMLAGPVWVVHVMVAVSHLARARRIGALHLSRFDRGLQMRLQQRHLGVEGMRRRKMRVSVACSQSRAAVRFQETKKPAAVAGAGCETFAMMSVCR